MMMMMINKIAFPVPENENQKKLFEEIKKCADYYDLCVKENAVAFKMITRSQVYGMIILYGILFPDESEKITNFWIDEVFDYFLR